MYFRMGVPRVSTLGRKRLTIKKCTFKNLNPSVSRNPLQHSQSDIDLKQKYPAVWEAAMEKAESIGLSVQRDTDLDNAKRNGISKFKDIATYALMKGLHIKTIESGEILVWELGIYRGGGQRQIGAICQALADDIGFNITSNFVGEVLGVIKRRTLRKFSDFDKDPMKMSFSNGVLDLETMTLKNHSPEFLTRIQIPWDFDPQATCPSIERAVTDIIGEENIPLIWEIFAHFLVKDYRFKRFPVFVGSKDSGKTILLQLMTELLGEENASSVAMQNLSDRFMKAELAGKLANISDDLPKGRVRDSSMLKRLSGRSRIQAEEKGKNPFSYTNFAKLIFSSNYKPWIDDPTDADFGRFMILCLHSKFGDPSKEEGVKLKDPTILAKLVNPKEMSGLINKALEGLKRLQAKNWEFSYRLTEAEVEALMLGRTDRSRDSCVATSRHIEAGPGYACCPWRSRQMEYYPRNEDTCSSRFAGCPALRCPVLRGWR